MQRRNRRDFLRRAGLGGAIESGLRAAGEIHGG